MKNPCDNCIVNVMCQNKCCVELEEYVKSLSDTKNMGDMQWNWKAIGKSFRKGDIILYADGRKNWWRVRRNEESMHSVYCQCDV